MGEAEPIVHIALQLSDYLATTKRPRHEQNRPTPKNILTDLAQIANGAVSAFGSLRSELDVMKASRTDRQAAPAALSHAKISTPR